MLLCHVMSSVRKMANNLDILVAMCSRAFALDVATGERYLLHRVSWQTTASTVCPIVGLAVATGKSGSFFLPR